MKKIRMGLFAVILAMVSFAFTSVGKSPKTSYYWFKLNGTTGDARKNVGLPPFQSTDPNGCSSGTVFCSGAYNSYVDNGDGTYSASGTRQITDMKP